MTTLQEWVNQSPNASKNNTLIQTIGMKKGKPVYYTYGWNLKPVDPREVDVHTLPDGTIITPEEAHKLL